ncbi:MAG: hypothetical protein AB9834_08315 [Lentimicrobium sp.]
MKATGRIFLVLILLPLFTAAQSDGYLEDKPGDFILENNLVKHTGLDYQALVRTATTTAGWFHQNNPLIQSPKGFNVNVSMFGNSLPAHDEIYNPGYGEMFSISFSFRYFYVEGGIEHTATGWSAHDIGIRFNQPFQDLAQPMGDRGFEAGDDPSLKEAINQAHDRLQRFYSLNPMVETVAPGIYIYAGGQLLISHPDQPSPWIQVTVGEITKAILEYYKIRKASDEYTLKKILEKMPEDMKQLYIDGAKVSVYDFVLNEFEQISPDDMNKPAFIDRQEGIYDFNTNGKGMPVVKYNPECWNKSWPPTSVQFVSMKYTITSKNDFVGFSERNNQLKDYVGLFINALPVEKMGELIQ